MISYCRVCSLHIYASMPPARTGEPPSGDLATDKNKRRWKAVKGPSQVTRRHGKQYYYNTTTILVLVQVSTFFLSMPLSAVHKIFL